MKTKMKFNKVMECQKEELFKMEKEKNTRRIYCSVEEKKLQLITKEDGTFCREFVQKYLCFKIYDTTPYLNELGEKKSKIGELIGFVHVNCGKVRPFSLKKNEVRELNISGTYSITGQHVEPETGVYGVIKNNTPYVFSNYKITNLIS